MGTNCNDPIPVRIEDGTPMRLLGLTTGKSASGSGSCGGGGIGFGAEDVAYDIQFASGGQSTIALDAAGTSYNSVLYLRNECNNIFAQISCDNAGGNGRREPERHPDGRSQRVDLGRRQPGREWHVRACGHPAAVRVDCSKSGRG